ARRGGARGGATPRPGSVGGVLTRNLASGGFSGAVYAVNPSRPSVHGIRAWPSVVDLPEAPDLAVIATPPDTVPAIVAQLADKGTRAAVILTAGFGEGDDATGRERLARTLAAARPHRLRIVGPNCLGILVPGVGLNASFAHIAAKPGGLAFVSQSGAIATAVLDWAEPRGIGFSHVVSMGTMADVDFGDLLDWLAQDVSCRAVLLYVEAIVNARKFLSAARACARLKPVMVVKAGRFATGARAARSHTGALAGSDAAYDAAFRRAGMLRVVEVEELFAAAETLAKARPIKGDRLAILTNGGGFGVLAADAVAAAGVTLASLAPDTVSALDRALPRTWSRGNPVDIIGDADAARYGAAMDSLVRDPSVDAVLVVNCPTAVASSTATARAVAASAATTDCPVLTSWVGESVQREARAVFAAAGIPTYDTPEAAVRAFTHMVTYRRNQEALRQVPVASASSKPDRAAARAIVAAARRRGDPWLTATEARALLACYRVPVNPLVAVASPEAAGAAAGPFAAVALKIDSPDIVHKSDVGGVMLGVAPDAVADSARRMLAAVRTARPDARVAGLTVEPMAATADAIETIVGATRDPDFGPLVLFGEGGTRVEIAADRALGLPPLNASLARDMMSRTRVDRLLAGYRGKPPADRDAVASVLVAVAELMLDLPAVAELDINPLLASPTGALALDARVRLQDPGSAVPSAIRPYPRELERDVAVGGGTLRLRPARPEDESAIAALLARTSSSDIRLSAFSALESFARDLAARVTQIDYDREIAMVAFDGNEALGVGHLRMGGDRERAEYGIIVRSDLHGRGIGTALLNALLDVARANNVAEVFGTVQAGNGAMRELAAAAGFSESPFSDGLVCTTLRLRAAAAD
ncbi:MAG: GNAT family N-acetyltransferase, partial [Gemmatimonas sp.]